MSLDERKVLHSNIYVVAFLLPSIQRWLIDSSGLNAKILIPP